MKANALILVLVTVCDLAAQPADASKQRGREMATMVQAVEFFNRPRTSEEPWTKALRTDKAVLSFNDANKDEFGSLWIWTNQGEPIGITEMFTQWPEHQYWGYNMISVSELPTRCVAGSQQWKRSNEDVLWQRVPDSAIPSQQRTIRLAQMREQARDFRVLHGPRSRPEQLRLLPQPVYRYPSTAKRDGAIFCFVHGNTNPEMLLLLRADGDRWEFLATPAAGTRMQLQHRGTNQTYLPRNNAIFYAHYVETGKPTVENRRRYPWKK